MFQFIDHYSLQIPLQKDLVLTNMQCEPGNSGIERRLLDDDFTLHTYSHNQKTLEKEDDF